MELGDLLHFCLLEAHFQMPGLLIMAGEGLYLEKLLISYLLFYINLFSFDYTTMFEF